MLLEEGNKMKMKKKNGVNYLMFYMKSNINKNYLIYIYLC